MTADGTLEQIDPESQEVTRTIGVGVHPGGLAVGEGSVWVTDADSPTLLRVDARYGSVDEIALPAKGGAGGVSVGAGSVWVAQGDSRVLRIEPRTGRVEHSFACGEASDALFADGKAWLVVRTGHSAAGGSRDERDRRVGAAASQQLLRGGRRRVRVDFETTRTVWKFSRHWEPLRAAG